MSAPRAPGVYRAPAEQRYSPISLGPSGVAGFVGLAERGPTNAPTRITDYAQFRRVYGELENDNYLDEAIKGFFENGGRVCYVLRVAHLVRRRREDIARSAFVKVVDELDQPTLTLRAANEGMWGNNVTVQLRRQEPRVSTFLTLDLRPSDTSAVIKSTLGLERGAVVRIHDGEKSAYRVVADLSGKTITWSRPLEHEFKSGAPTYIEPVEFTVEARWGMNKELFENLSMSPNNDRYVVRAINGSSELIRVEDHRSSSELPQNFPVALEEQALKQGSDGMFTVTPDDFIGANIGPEERFGIAAFEAVDEVDLLVAPDLMWALKNSAGFRTEKDVEVVQDAMVSQCARLRTRFALLDVPDPVEHKRAGQWRLLFDTPYAAFYYPWVVVEDRRQQVRLVPPTGHVAGIIAKCDATEGAYRAPANEDLTGVVDLGRELNDTDLGAMNAAGINCLKSFPRRGIRIWGARTAASDPQWRYINVRRTMNAIIASVEQGLQWAVFEANSQFLWKTLTRQITAFLIELYKAGYFQGRTPEEAFFVKCDAETNPPEVRDAGMVVVECGVAPVRPAEFLVFRVTAEREEPEQA